MPGRRELAAIWAEMVSEGLPDLADLVGRPSKVIGEHSRRRVAEPVAPDFRFPKWRRAV